MSSGEAKSAEAIAAEPSPVKTTGKTPVEEDGQKKEKKASAKAPVTAEDTGCCIMMWTTGVLPNQCINKVFSCYVASITMFIT